MALTGKFEDCDQLKYNCNGMLVTTYLPCPSNESLSMLIPMTQWHSFPVVLVELQFTRDQDTKCSQGGHCSNLGYIFLLKDDIALHAFCTLFCYAMSQNLHTNILFMQFCDLFSFISLCFPHHCNIIVSNYLSKIILFFCILACK